MRRALLIALPLLAGCTHAPALSAAVPVARAHAVAFDAPGYLLDDLVSAARLWMLNDDADANHDGVLSKTELRKAHLGAAFTAKYDTNKDGAVSAAELAAPRLADYATAMQNLVAQDLPAWDQDHDQHLTLGEMFAAKVGIVPDLGTYEHPVEGLSLPTVLALADQDHDGKLSADELERFCSYVYGQGNLLLTSGPAAVRASWPHFSP